MKGLSNKRLSTKEMLKDIGSMRKLALELANSNAKYSHLLRILLADDYFYSDKKTVPTLDSLCKASGMNAGKVRKLIEVAYNDLVLKEDKRPQFSFSKVRYEFFVEGWGKKTLSMLVDRLPLVPRVGEDITIPFFEAYLKVSNFYIDQIHHHFEEGTQVIMLRLKPGPFNSYWKYRKDKAIEELELSFQDLADLDEIDLKRKLKIGKH